MAKAENPSTADLSSLQRLKLLKEIEILDIQLASPRSFLAEVGRQFRTQFFAVVNPILIVVLTLLSTLLLDSFRQKAATTRDRQATFESVSRELGYFRFMAELVEEFTKNNWTSLDEITSINSEYNEVITRLRNDEFKSRSLITKYWGAEAVAEFDSVMQRAKDVDHAVHGMNEDIGNLLRKAKQAELAKQPAVRERMDATKAAAVSEDIGKQLRPYKDDVNRLIETLTRSL